MTADIIEWVSAEGPGVAREPTRVEIQWFRPTRQSRQELAPGHALPCTSSLPLRLVPVAESEHEREQSSVVEVAEHAMAPSRTRHAPSLLSPPHEAGPLDAGRLRPLTSPRTTSETVRSPSHDPKTIRAYLNGERATAQRERASPDPFDGFVDDVTVRLIEDPLHIRELTTRGPG